MQSTETQKKLSPFELADNIFMKQGCLEDAAAMGYHPYMMNKIAANNRDTVFFAAKINPYPGLTKQMSYRFYYDALEKGRRNGKWHKKKKSDEIASIAVAFGVNTIRAAQYHQILGESGIAAVIASQEKGGRGKSPAKAKPRGK